VVEWWMTKFVLANFDGLFLCATMPGMANLFDSYDDAKANVSFGGQKLFIGECQYNPETKHFVVNKWQDGSGEWLDANNGSPRIAIDKKYLTKA
jgi:hypothetical protein